jgi:hypothetical protein
MNKIILGLMLTTLMMVGCTNQDQEFDDFTTQSVYFPLQYPIRTIVLGEDRIDNSIDLQKAFNIGVSIGGMYDNKSDRKVGFQIVPTLFPDITLGLDTLYGKDASNVEYKLNVLPTSYYSLVPDSIVTVPKGGFSGLIRVNLTDAFFDDPKAYSVSYVIPMKIKNVSDNFSILSGKAASTSIVAPRWYVAADWATGYLPKDYTIFGVKFINVWHGTYFQRGVQIKDGVVDKKFHTLDISSNQNAKLETVGLKKATYNRMGEKLTTATANYKSLLTFSDDVNGEGDITVSTAPGTAYTITGTGKYYKSATAMGKNNGWMIDPLNGNLKGALTVTLDFKVKGLAGATEYQFTDTLVFRSNDVKYEEFAVSLHPKK